MFGRTPYEAVQNFRSALQRAISCVTPAVIIARGSGYHPGSEHTMILGDTESVKLPGADVALTMKLLARVQERGGHSGEWRVTTTAYSYTLSEPEGREIIVYHFHPGRRSPVEFAHLHLEAGARVTRAELQKAHIPTGFVEPEHVIWLSIREFGARPRRNDWEEVLRGAQAG